MRGSPIRKSSDQRSVDSSPRLIAASYVLHRLLVPRHPPCALNNLATQKSHPSTPGRTSMSGPTQTLYYRVRRCSRPLCSSQRTTGHRPSAPAEPTRPAGRPVVRETGRPRQEITDPPGIPRTSPLPQDPTACLRPDPTPHRFPHPAGPYSQRNHRSGRTGQRSTLELHPRHPQPPRSGNPFAP